MTSQDQEDLIHDFAEAIYSSNCALSMFESHPWKKFFKKLRPCFKVPSRKVLSTTLLDSCYTEYRQEVKSTLNSVDMLAIITDGWTNIRHEGIINFILSSTVEGPYFYKFVEPKENSHTAEYIFDQISEIIEEVGEDKITSVITDNAKNMKRAWELLNEKYVKIQTYGCACHVLNLLLKDFEDFDSMKCHLAAVKSIVHFFKIKHIPAAVLKSKQSERAVSLKMPVPTRWATNFTMMQSLQCNKTCLQSCVIEESVSVIISANDRLNIFDPLFWKNNEELLSFLKPFVDLITLFENNSTTISDVKYSMTNVVNKFKKDITDTAMFNKKEISKIKKKIDYRYKMAITPCHNAAYLLDPRYLGDGLSDNEIDEALAVLLKMSKGQDANTGTDLLSEITNFKSRSGHLFDNRLMWKVSKNVKTGRSNSSSSVLPHAWWKMWLNETKLCEMAVKLLTMPASSAASERNWSTWNLIHSKLRNRLETERAGKLTFVKEYLLLKYRPKTIKQKQDEETSHETDVIDPEDGAAGEPEEITEDIILVVNDEESDNEAEVITIIGNLHNQTDDEFSVEQLVESTSDSENN